MNSPVPVELPSFQLPFRSGLSPIADTVIEHTSLWARASGLVPDEPAVQRLHRGGIMTAGPWLVPGAPMRAACLVSDWTVFLIVIDDEFDDGQDLGTSPDLAEAAIEDLVAAFRGTALARTSRFPALAGAAGAIADLGRRFEAAALHEEWLIRFWRNAEDHLESKVSEALHRASGAALDVPSYVAMRRLTSAGYTYADLVEVTEQVVIAERVRQSPDWGLLIDAFTDVRLGIQDICSCAKEVSAGDDLNLAAVMARASGRSLQQGIDDAYKWVCERSAAFTAARAGAAALPRRLGLDADAEAGVARYIEALDLLLGGHLTWNSQDNPRYSQTASCA